MGAAVSSGAAGEGSLVETYRCHACGCNWRQQASRETNSCPQCEGDFVERISVGVASRPTINMESIQQAMEELEQSGGNMSAMSMHEMLMNIAQFRAQAMGMTALGSGDEDADLREALARSVQESESKPSLPPPASLKAIGTLRSNKYSRVLHGKDENCVICTEAYQLGEDVTKMPCQHLFHKSCLTPWLQNTNSCPVCRHQLETDDVDYEAKRTTPSSTPMGTPQRVAPAPAAPAASSVVRRVEGEVGGAARQSRFVVQSSSSSGDEQDDDDDDDDDAEGSVRAGRRDLDAAGDGEGEEGSAASAISRWARQKALESSSSSSAAAARRAGSSGGAQQQEQRRQQQETASSSSRTGGDRTGGASGVGRGGASRRSGATTGRVTTPAPPPQPRASPSGSWPRGVGIVGGGATSGSRGGAGGGSRPGSFRGGASSSSLSGSGTNGRASNAAAAVAAAAEGSSTTAAASGALSGTRRAGSGTGGGAAASASRRG